MTRRELVAAGVGVVCGTRAFAMPADDILQRITILTGRTPTLSDRVHLDMPRVFPNGYTVPLAFAVDSPMSDADHVQSVRVFAPRNPLPEVAAFYFAPGRSTPRVATRIRLAEPQIVAAVATMNDGTLIMAQTWVDVASNGCK